MGQLSHAGIYLVQTLVSLYLLAVLLRFFLQLVRADFYNPVSRRHRQRFDTPLTLERRGLLPFDLVYETYGTLNADAPTRCWCATR
jgi:YggT family protein